MRYKKQNTKQERRALILTTTATTTRQQPYLIGCVKPIEKQATKKKTLSFVKLLSAKKIINTNYQWN